MHRFQLVAVCGVLSAFDPSSVFAQNLLTNPGFDVGLSGWTNQGATWSTLDAANSPLSGSVQLSDDPSAGVPQITQCVAATPGLYDASVEYRVPSGQSAGNGVFRVWSFPNANCTGGFQEVYEVDTAPGPFNAWLPAKQVIRVPVGAQSALFQLFFQSNQAGATFTGLYDNAFLASGDSGLILGGSGRFLVKASWETPQPQTGNGHAQLLTGDTGYFWFFNPANVEVVVKVLDGCALNNRFWVFAAGLTNVKVVLTVTDRFHGTVRTYTNPINTQFAPIQDTAAFPCS